MRRTDVSTWAAIDLAVFDRLANRGVGSGGVGRVQEQVVAGGNGADGGLAGRHHLRHRVHTHRVGVDQTAKAEILAEETGDRRAAERRRRRRRRVERGKLDVRGHHRADTGGDAGPERRQLDLLEPFARVRDDRQAEVTVDVGVAVTGEMLERRNHATGGEAARIRHREGRDLRGILAEGAGVDHGIARVVVDVDDGREVDVNAHRPRFDGGDPAGLERQTLIAGGAEGHGARKRRGAGDTESGAGLEIGGDEQRQRRLRLQTIEQRRGGQGLPECHRAIGRIEQHRRRRLRPAKDVKATDVLVADEPRESIEGVAVRADVGGLERRDQQLTHLLIEGQRRQRLLHPTLGRAIERRGLSDNECCPEHGSCNGPAQEDEAAPHVGPRQHRHIRRW